MTSSPESSKPPTPAYAESELYDSPEDLARWLLLAPLLRSWQIEVWEKDHNEYRGCWQYDQEAIRLQQRHRWAVVLAALAGSAAVIFAILQLGMEHRVCGPYLANYPRIIIGSSLGPAGVQEMATTALMWLEVACLILAVVVIGFSGIKSLDHRWRELRFKAEHYRMLKFRFLHDAAHWLAAGEEQRGLHLFEHLTQIHAVDHDGIREWIHWKKDIVPVLQAPAIHPNDALAAEQADYFRQRRITPQRKYFSKRGHQLHNVERIVRWVGPGLFLASILCAVAHAILHVVHAYEQRAAQAQETSEVSAILLWAFFLALLAAILPTAAAGLRTWRGAFEFGRNSLRFESMAHHLQHLLQELDKAKSPEAILSLLRRGEYAMESEHRAWMRLMMEAEWFG